VSLNSKIQVPLPEKGVIVAKAGNYPYVYRVVETFRDEKGQPSNKKRSIGKLDSSTGQLIPNAAYYEYYGQDEFGHSQWDGGRIYEVGVPFLTGWIFSSLGISQILVTSLGNEEAESAATVAAYMLAEGNVMSYLDDFCERSLLKNHISDKSASRLFASISSEKRMTFFRKWVAIRQQSEYMAYDVTSFSSYAEGIEDAEWGYNRDGERLPQINMALYMGQKSLLPIFYAIYPSSIVDKSHLPYMMAYNEELGISDVCFVMDRGFASSSNMEYMRSKGYLFIMAVESRTKAFKAVIRERKDLVRLSCQHIDSMKIFGLGVKRRFLGVTSTLHIFYAPERAAEQIADMYRKIASEEEKLAQMKMLTKSELKRYRKHFIITQRDDGSGFSYERNHSAIDAFVGNLGYFCILSNGELSSEEVLLAYRRRDIIEKGFDEIKNHIDMKRLRTHNQETMEGKMFCAYLSLIVRMHIANKLSKWMDDHRFTIERVIRELTKIRTVSSLKSPRLLNPLTKLQREILEAFGAGVEDVKKYVEAP
jgi:transposase